ncbi:MAG: cardiolipin synthase B [Gemmatimonadetes bacterium]|nr:cardiolipin synthase B [Gemmatimonadota bacterium]
MKDPRVLSLPDGDQVGRAVPGARATFPGQGMDRAAGSPVIPGNSIKLQFEGALTFEAWIEAIDAAERFVHFENYILRDDRVGRAFRDALVAKARQGVPVRVLYDWIGCWATPRRYWSVFKEAGVEVRAFNRPSARDPFGVLQRDHRKLVCVDGFVAFVGGFCVGEEWAGKGNEPPWRDTGVEFRGPAAAVAARSFERVWSLDGSPVPDELRVSPDDQPVAGYVPIWVIEGLPGRSRVYRTLQLIAAYAQRRIWITDPYFVAPRPVAEALAAAARDGVDVRILLPAHNNWPWVGSLSRGGYRFLMESGVRLFEWQGPMIHAKTSVADGLWSRVGSSNLNNASLLGNFELDVGVLDEDLARQMEGLFLADLASSVEIVLPRRHLSLFRAAESEQLAADEPTTLKASLEPEDGAVAPLRAPGGNRGKGTGWKLANLVRAGTTLGSAIAGNRALGREDRALLGTVSFLLVGLALLAGFFPAAFGWLIAVVAGWLGIVTGVRAFVQFRRARLEENRLKKVYERLDERSP